MMDKVNQRIAALQPYKPGKPIDELARELASTTSSNWRVMKIRWVQASTF